jgi:predicted nucleotidyltransferase
MLDDRRDTTGTDDIQNLLTEALRRLRLPNTYGVLLEGSVAEGFGNRTSDIDFLIVTEGPQSKRLPTVMFIDGRRVEVRIRCADEIADHAAHILGAGGRGDAKIGALSRDELDIFQRFAHAIVLRDSPIVRLLLASHDRELFRSIALRWHALRAIRASNRAWLMRHFGKSESSAAWMRNALIAAGKAGVAAVGELYITDKWLDRQYRRANFDKTLRDRMWSLIDQRPTEDELPEHLDKCLLLMKDFGVDGCQTDLSDVQIVPRAGITTWQLGAQVCVLRDKTEIYVFGSTAARMWRSIVFWMPIAHVIKRAKVDEKGARECIERFHRLGLIEVAWADGDTWLRTGAAPMILPTGSFVSFDGFHVAQLGAKDVGLFAVPAPRLCFSGAEFVWANMCLENAWEDFIGVYEQKHWKLVQTALQRLVGWACLILFSACGVSPAPDIQEVTTRIDEIPAVAPDLAAEALRLRLLRCDSEDDAIAGRKEVETFLHKVKEIIGGRFFPSSFEHADDWRSSLEYGFDWGRMASFVDPSLSSDGRSFPMEEVRDMLAVNQGEARAEGIGVATYASNNFGRWHRGGSGAPAERGNRP